VLDFDYFFACAAGFLPVLGFWMMRLGLLITSLDFRPLLPPGAVASGINILEVLRYAVARGGRFERPFLAQSRLVAAQRLGLE